MAKKLLNLCLLLAVAAVSGLAGAAGHNPFDDMFASDARRERQAGSVRAVFVVFAETGDRLFADFAVTYRDESGMSKQVKSDSDGKAAVIFSRPGKIQALQLAVGENSYDIMGDNYEDFDWEDVREGQVEYFALQTDRKTKLARIYDAD
jgi:hypothetical protein